MTGTLVLDTPVLLWALLEPDRIPDATLERIRRSDTELAVSAASAWEIATKARLGKLDGAQGVVHGYHDHLARLRATELPITSQHALTAGSLAWDHRDPFDRMIVSQCLVSSSTLVTADAAIRGFPGVAVLW